VKDRVKEENWGVGLGGAQQSFEKFCRGEAGPTTRALEKAEGTVLIGGGGGGGGGGERKRNRKVTARIII